MCGIVGCVGQRPAEQTLLQGLRRLEYRGYDSAGVAAVTPLGELSLVKSPGRIDRLARRLSLSPLAGPVGIGHTRWATHGAANERNAHPHLSSDGAVAIVHNGVIENYAHLKQELVEQGFQFASQTDSEVIANLIASHLRNRWSGNGSRRNGSGAYEDLTVAIGQALAQLRGTFGLVVLFNAFPEVILAARRGSPLVIGRGTSEYLVASDAAALAGMAERIVYLADHELALITAERLSIVDRDLASVEPREQAFQVSSSEVQLNGYPHYMLKEIHEQPESIQNTMRGRLDPDDATAHFGGLNLTAQQLRAVDRIVLTACGTSWHAALVGEYAIEQLARLPVEVEYASELRYRNPPLESNTLLFAITQSGETADTLAALREMKRKGHHTLAICNVVGSTIAQEADGGIYLHAGPEIGVASTKAFTSQCAALLMLALYLGRLRHLSFSAGRQIIAQLNELPRLIERTLEVGEQARRIAMKYCNCENFLYLGRHFNFPTALEGALKLKEISYIHAEGYPAAEMKHGPIALVDERTPSVFVNPNGFLHEKALANMEEIKARGGPVIAVVCREDTQAAALADEVMYVPRVEEYLKPIVATIPLQLLAYHMALARGCDVDKPRNLAKSVTVE